MSDVCAICLENDTDIVKEWQTTVCCHKFHKECLASLPKDQRKCPLCRTKLEENVEHISKMLWCWPEPQQIYESSPSELTFFRIPYRRHTNFTFGEPSYPDVLSRDEYREDTSYSHDEPISLDFHYSGSANFSRVVETELRLIVEPNGNTHIN